MKLLGYASRESGQSRVPAPPHKMNGKTLRITPRQTPPTGTLSSILRTPRAHDVKSWQKRDRSPLLSRPVAPTRAMVEPERKAAGRATAAQEGLQRGGNHDKSA